LALIPASSAAIAENASAQDNRSGLSSHGVNPCTLRQPQQGRSLLEERQFASEAH
jgi:hypothetical protein